MNSIKTVSWYCFGTMKQFMDTVKLSMNVFFESLRNNFSTLRYSQKYCLFWKRTIFRVIPVFLGTLFKVVEYSTVTVQESWYVPSLLIVDNKIFYFIIKIRGFEEFKNWKNFNRLGENPLKQYFLEGEFMSDKQPCPGSKIKSRGKGKGKGHGKGKGPIGRPKPWVQSNEHLLKTVFMISLTLFLLPSKHRNYFVPFN